MMIDFNGVSPALTVIGFVATLLMLAGIIAAAFLALAIVTAFVFDWLPELISAMRAKMVSLFKGKKGISDE